MEDTVIREATEQDAALIAEIAASTFVETFAGSNSEEDMAIFLKQTYGVPQQTKEIQDSRTLYLLAFKGEECVAFSKLVFDTPPDAPVDMSPLGTESSAAIDYVELAKCYVRKVYHGTGIADKLMAASLEAVPKRISKKKVSDESRDPVSKRVAVWLGVWEFNPRAIRFYTRYGFAKVGVHHFVLGNDVQDDWLMAKFV